MNPTRNICDSHCHIYPDGISYKAIKAIDRFYGGLPTTPQDGTLQTLLAGGKKNGIKRFLVHSVATRPEQVSNINLFLADRVSDQENVLIGFGTLHPDSDDLRSDFEQLCALGLKGVKLHPDIQQFRVNEPKAMRIFEMCEAAGVPVLVHTGDYRFDYSNPARTAVVLRTFPKLKFIGAHLGGWSVWDDAGRLLPDYPNVMVDTSSSFYWLKPDKAKALIRAFGSERVMFGTDYPMWPQRYEIDYLYRLDLTDDEYDNIFWRSFEREFVRSDIEQMP